MYKSLLAVATLLTVILLHGCKSGGSLAKAEEAFRKEQYFNAIDLYKKAYSSTREKSERARLSYMVAESYLLSHDYNRAEGWYQKAINLGYSDPIIYEKLAEVQKMAEKYEEALVAYEAYSQEMPSDQNAQENIELIKGILDPNGQCERFIVESFKPANSTYNDFSPAVVDKKGIYFTSDREEASGRKVFGRTGQAYSDIFVLEKERRGRTERWGDPVPLEGEVNSDFAEGTPAFDKRASFIYYTQCNGTDGKSPNCVIMMARRKGQGYGSPEVVGFATDTTIDYGMPTLSPDGDKMIFSMDGPHGLGGHDLYLSTYVRRSRTWSDPVNLGPNINTPGDDMFPYYYNDTTLYFATDGRPGYGGLDIWVATGSGAEWNKPKHIRAPLNSGGDDFGIVFEEGGESGYFTSNRIAGQIRARGDDIFSFKVVPLVFTLSGVVTNSVTGEKMPDATVTLINTSTNEKLTAQTDKTGSYQFKLKEHTQYTVMASKRAYYNSSTYYPSTIGLECSKDLTQDLQVTPNEVVLSLQGIYYGLDSFNLRPESLPIIDSLIGIMNTYPYIVVELGSHTDCRASFAYNDTLSQKRADTVVNYMIAKGIERERLVPKGFGERQLVNNCACEPNNVGPGAKCTEEEHQLNRRTTFRVLRNDYQSTKQKEENNEEDGDDGGDGGEDSGGE